MKMTVMSWAFAASFAASFAAALTATGAAAQPKAAEPAASAASATKARAKAKAVKKAPARAASSPPSASADWNAQLASCKNEAGMNLVKREKCVYAHCKGHWGQGECPPGQDMPTKDSFKNPFKRGS